MAELDFNGNLDQWFEGLIASYKGHFIGGTSSFVRANNGYFSTGLGGTRFTFERTGPDFLTGTVQDISLSQITLPVTFTDRMEIDGLDFDVSNWFTLVSRTDTGSSGIFNATPFLADMNTETYTVTGSADNDIAQSGAYLTFAGNDRFSMGGGNDTVAAGAGKDRVLGGHGNDALSGQDGNDILRGNAGNDTLIGGDGNDRISGGNGRDTLGGGDGRDTLNGDKGRDTLAGDKGSDLLDGGAGADQLSGGNGADRLIGGTGADQLTGGQGADTFVFGDGDGRDRIHDFQDNIDQIELDSALWTGTRTAQQVVNDFGVVTNQGAVFDFGDGDLLIVTGVTNLNTLVDDLTIV